MKDIGKPLFWNLETHFDAIVQMIRADEIQIAMQMIDQVPAWYRENPQPELTWVKQKLYEQLYDQIEYATDDEEANCSREFGEAQWDNGYMFPRAEIISKLVRSLNTENKTPWVVDLGCSHGNLPLGLMKTNHRFTYWGKGLNHRIVTQVKEWVGDLWAVYPSEPQTKILYCTEVIEHCMNPMDVVQSACKIGVTFDYILLSVPLGCLGGGLHDWSTRRLGHVRGWTKQEFFDFANKHWPGYQWELTVAPSMVLLGKKP